ncbi:MAG TPA: orotidine-5'-phosphate decarboxylase [Trueperaceae bacterium]
MTFPSRLHDRIRATNSRVCLGIDPRPEAHPLTHPDRFVNDPAQLAKAVVHYFRAIIEATEDLVACYKPQAAFFEALGIPGLIALAQLLADIRSRGVPVLLDAKRGDIGSTAEAYARAYLTDSVFSADALTVNPYLGMNSLEPFITQSVHNDRGIFVLVKTSNPGNADFQELQTANGAAMYERVAERVAETAAANLQGESYSAVGAVAGATLPADTLAALRRRMPHSILLLPGYGAQGGTLHAAAEAFDSEGLGAVVSASRSLTYTSKSEDFAAQARAATLSMKDALNRNLEQ